MSKSWRGQPMVIFDNNEAFIGELHNKLGDLVADSVYEMTAPIKASIRYDRTNMRDHTGFNFYNPRARRAVFISRYLDGFNWNHLTLLIQLCHIDGVAKIEEPIARAGALRYITTPAADYDPFHKPEDGYQCLPHGMPTANFENLVALVFSRLKMAAECREAHAFIASDDNHPITKTRIMQEACE